MYIFLILGIILMVAPFLSNQLKAESKKTKTIAFGIFFLIGGSFIYIGGSHLYEDFFNEYPSMKIANYTDYKFDKYNAIKIKYAGEDVIDIESGYETCEDGYCRQISDKRPFEAADLDSNGMITKKELNNLVKTFDTNQDGFLNFPEARIKTFFKAKKKCENEILNNAYPIFYGKSWKQ